MKLEPAVYWKLKAKFLELLMMERQIGQRKSEALIEAGLDPTKNYVMHDDETSVTSQDGNTSIND